MLERWFEVPDHLSRAAWRARLVLALAMALWGGSIVFTRLNDEPPVVLHLTLILFHEAGHILFLPFGEVLRVAGGTLAQWLMPLVCVVALHRHGDNFGAALALAWAGLSGVDAAFYAWDAADPVLPLIGGGTGADSFHDFVFLFERFGQGPHARGWALAMKAVGILVWLLALVWAALLLALQRDAIED